MIRILSAVFVVLTVAACAPEDAVPPGDPAVGNPEMRGFIYADDAMAAGQKRFYWVQQAVSGYERAKKTDLPAEIAVLPNGNCRFPRAGDNESLRHVHISHGTQKTSVYQFSNEDIDKRAERYVSTYLKSKGRLKHIGEYRDDANLINVVVTKTDKPVYLVLTSQSHVIWNIQKAPDAAISRIALVGAKAVGVANVPEGTSVLASYRDVFKACGVRPFRRPQDDWGLIEDSSRPGMQEVIRKNHGYANEYWRWLLQTFGAPEGGSTVEVLGISNVLVGDLPPSPEAPVPFAPFAGARLVMSRNDYVMATSHRQYQKKHNALVRAAAEKAVGGDLESLGVGK